MSGTLWSKFYWSDWLSDSGLRRSSLAARGLWIDMLCIAAQADLTGYLAVKKHPLTAHDIARMVGGSDSEVATLIDELERNGVLSRDRNGMIYSRRMVKDDRTAKISQKNGKKGGNPSLGKRDGIYDRVNPPDKGPLNTQEPEARGQKPEEPNLDSLPNRESVGGRASARPAAGFFDAPDNTSGAYAFIGRIVRLNQKDFDRWRAAYRAIPDFLAALQKADDYYSQNPPPDGKWFFPVSRWLEKENSEHQRITVNGRRGEDWW